MIGNRQGQISLLEFLMLLTAVCTGIFAAQLYAKRAVAGRLKSAADAYGSAFSSLGQGRLEAVKDQEQRLKSAQAQAIGVQFSPKYSNYTVTYRSTGRAYSQQNLDGSSFSVDLEPDVTQKTAGGLDDFSNVPLRDENLF